MGVHCKQPRDVETDIPARHGLPSLGERDSTYDGDNPHPGLHQAKAQTQTQPSRPTPTSGGPRRTSKRIGRAKQSVLQQRPPRKRLGRGGQLPTRTETRTEDGPGASSRGSDGRYSPIYNSPSSPDRVDQVPCRDREPSPPDYNGDTSSPWSLFYDSLGADWGWQEPPCENLIPGSFCGAPWEGSIWELRGPEHPSFRGIQPGRLEAPGHADVPRQMACGTELQVQEQVGALDKSIHPKQSRPKELVQPIPRRPASCILEESHLQH